MSEAMPAELQAQTFPDPVAQRRFGALVGIDEIKNDLLIALRVAANPKAVKEWAAKNGVDTKVVEMLVERPQLFVLGGDVGTGKTELAETIGDALAREIGSVTLFSISLSARGSGFVGEMTQRIVQAFDYVRAWGEKRKSKSGSAGILFIDEADAIAQSRQEAQMHHEDRAGVNALIRSIDDLTKAGAPVGIILATNRLGALDPAVLRRAANVFEFSRPGDAQRGLLFASVLPTATPEEIAKIVAATGTEGRRYGYTYSDIRQRLIPAAALRAFTAKSTFDASMLVAEATRLAPTPPFDS